jgi:3',5'-cyclic AMP phosphodiesterase CpdA
MNGFRWRQLIIVHVSDLHFGSKHTFNAPGGGANAGRPTLSKSIIEDLWNGNFAVPSEFIRSVQSEVGNPGDLRPRVVIAITGDFNERSVEPEFQQSRTFVSDFYGATVLEHRLHPKDVFMVPGNHDLKYAEAVAEDRWSKYCLFYEDHDQKRSNDPDHRSRFDPRKPAELTRVIDQAKDGLIVVEINSSAYVQKDTREERRGQIDEQAIANIKKDLEKIDPKLRHDAIKVALVHHHPVVLPVLAEDDKGYDAILNSELLLDVLKRYGFHVILHGHKHYPHTYSYDAVCAWSTDGVQPMLVIAGGSTGSRELPDDPGSTNTYNVISIKWDPGASQARIHVETRGLVRFDNHGRALLGPEWHWKTLRLDDRILRPPSANAPSPNQMRKRLPADQEYDDRRSAVILDTRRNYPAIDVLPSLDPAQGYEARVWLEGQDSHEDHSWPSKVEWSASPAFFPTVYVCERALDPEYRARFAYYGPTLIQARMFWPDGHEAQAYVFARIPRMD